jgi:hypothetical protein
LPRHLVLNPYILQLSSFKLETCTVVWTRSIVCLLISLQYFLNSWQRRKTNVQKTWGHVRLLTSFARFPRFKHVHSSLNV